VRDRDLVKKDAMDLKVRLIVLDASFMLIATIGFARRIHSNQSPH
jgi:hypothetical protein